MTLSFALLSAAPSALAQTSPSAPATGAPAAAFPEAAPPAPLPSATVPPPEPAPPTSTPIPEPPPPQTAPPPLLDTPPPAAESTPSESAPLGSEDPDEAREDERGLYLLAALLGSLHAHVSNYYVSGDGEVRMGSVGLAYELLLMIGSRKKDFAFGGAASFVHAPRPELRLEFPGDLEYEPDARPGIFAATIGPAVDYRPGRAFHIGGLLGVAIEGVPEFELEPSERDIVAGLGMGLWLGFDWKASEHLRPGILLTGHVRREAKRDVDNAEDDDDDIEASLSLGLGFSLAYH